MATWRREPTEAVVQATGQIYTNQTAKSRPAALNTTSRSQLVWLWRSPCAPQKFLTGVSLHSHTSFSEESLSFLEDAALRSPWARPLMTRATRKAWGKEKRHIQLKAAFWVPPLTPRLAFELERRQIQALGLKALVSLSDHDTMDAGIQLAALGAENAPPISVEWSVPFGDALFHVGVHNLAAHEAREWMNAMSQYTADPSEVQLDWLLTQLQDRSDVLIVLNHPLWDLYGAGELAYSRHLSQFLSRYQNRIHALELNGLRDRNENCAVVALAREWDMLLISGGDRHGMEANANINLTNAHTFAEFVHEIRYERKSTVLFMPQYSQPWSSAFWPLPWMRCGIIQSSPGVCVAGTSGSFIPMATAALFRFAGCGAADRREVLSMY